VRQRVGALRRLFDQVGAALAALPPAERALRATEAAAWTGQQAAEVGLRAVAD
jgi:hypothetical protein